MTELKSKAESVRGVDENVEDVQKYQKTASFSG